MIQEMIKRYIAHLRCCSIGKIQRFGELVVASAEDGFTVIVIENTVSGSDLITSERA